MRILCGIILAAAMALAANGAEVVSFKDAAKIKTWDAWHDHEKGENEGSELIDTVKLIQ